MSNFFPSLRVMNNPCNYYLRVMNNPIIFYWPTMTCIYMGSILTMQLHTLTSWIDRLLHACHHFAMHKWPRTAAASTIGMSSFVAMLLEQAGISKGHWSCSQLIPVKAPQPHEPEASGTRVVVVSRVLEWFGVHSMGWLVRFIKCLRSVSSGINVTRVWKTHIIAQNSIMELLPLLDSLFFNEQNGR